MASTSTDITGIISEIAGVPVNDISCALSALGFNEDMCSDLAEELNNYVEDKKSGAAVSDTEITADLTVQNVIALVSQKIAA